MTWRCAAAMLLWGATLSACVYTFDNPVEAQSEGTVTGQLTRGQSVAGQSIAGAQVQLLWSDLTVTADAQGQFSFVDLPAGTYRLNVTVPPGGSGQLPIELSEGQIYLPQTPGGPSDALALGSIALDLAGVVGGTVAGLGGGGAVVGAFEPDPPDGGVGEFEGYATATDPTGAYSLTLPPGTHQLWASTATGSGTLVTAVQAGQSVAGQDLTLAPPQGGATADLVGGAVVGDYGADATAAELQAVLLDGGLSVGVEPSSGLIGSPISAYGTAEQAAGVTALQIEQQLQPGALYTVTVGPPSFLGTGQLVPAVLPNIPAIAGRATFLRQIFVFSVATVDANGGIADAGVDAGVADAGPVDAGLPFAAQPTLLVDNDGNTSPPSGDTSLQTFENWLNGAGVTYTTYLEPADGDDGSDAGYTYLVADGGSIDGFGTIVFFSGGSNADQLLSTAQQLTLQQWLNAGGHTLILFSPELVYSIGVDDWNSTESDGLLSSDVGASADLEDPNVWLPDAGGDDEIQSTLSTVVTGSSVAGFTGMQWVVLPTTSSSSVTYDFSVIEPEKTGVDILATIQADPASTDTGNVPAPVALGHRHAGAAGTSTVIWVGFPVEDIGANQSGYSNLAGFLAAVEAYARLP